MVDGSWRLGIDCSLRHAAKNSSRTSIGFRGLISGLIDLGHVVPTAIEVTFKL
jgi:hypothetical protein